MRRNVLIAIMMSIMGFVAVAKQTNTEHQAGPFKLTRPVGPFELTYTERAAVEDTIRNELKDPQSAQFTQIRGGNFKENDGTIITYVCGLVNAKNSFGGYTGAIPFLGEIKNDRLELELASTAKRRFQIGNICMVFTGMRI